MTDRTTSGDALATEFAAAQNLGTSNTAARISRASRPGSGMPSDSSIAVQPVSKSPMVPAGDLTKNGEPPLLTEFFLDVGHFQRIDERLDVAVENVGQLVQGQIDAMVGDAILRIIVCSNLSGSIAGSNLGLAHSSPRCLLLGDSCIE